MKVSVKKELIIERERTVTIKFENASGEKYCTVCRERQLFITVNEAALFRQTTARHIFQMVEANLIHLDETDHGLLLICLASLPQIMDENFLLPEKYNKKILNKKIRRKI